MDAQILEGKRILVVDDEPDILDTVKEVLASSQVVPVGSFDEALRLINAESFDLVILDIMGVNGFALLEACRENKLPAAMLTAHAINVESQLQSSWEPCRFSQKRNSTGSRNCSRNT